MRESTVQLIYYNALIFYQYFRFPLRELQFAEGISPTALWIGSMILQIFTGTGMRFLKPAEIWGDKSPLVLERSVYYSSVSAHFDDHSN